MYLSMIWITNKIDQHFSRFCGVVSSLVWINLDMIMYSTQKNIETTSLVQLLIHYILYMSAKAVHVFT
jgi:hypothetical protein